MESVLDTGIEGKLEFTVQDGLTTDLGGLLPAPVLSTPGMIKMMERTSSLLVQPKLDSGKTSVGFEVCVKHVASAPLGSHCTVQSRLDEIIEGRKLRFSVEVLADDGRTIGTGTHERRIIETGERH